MLAEIARRPIKVLNKSTKESVTDGMNVKLKIMMMSIVTSILVSCDSGPSISHDDTEKNDRRKERIATEETDSQTTTPSRDDMSIHYHGTVDQQLISATYGTPPLGETHSNPEF
jgi:hypothetical protein